MHRNQLQRGRSRSCEASEYHFDSTPEYLKSMEWCVALTVRSYFPNVVNANSGRSAMDEILQALNEAQRQAVEYAENGVLQILAGPGSGKTRVLSSRVAYLLRYHGLRPHDVVVATFTVKAANEMKTRIGKMVDNMDGQLIMGTFHSIARRYLLAYGGHIGLRVPFGIADTTDQIGLIKTILREAKIDMKPNVVRSRISFYKATNAAAAMSGQSREVYDTYQQMLEQNNMLDYDDLLLKCLELLKVYPICVRNVQHVFVDEFQDTNTIQYELMTQLASAKSHITVVGDPDQSIYGFRAADTTNLHRMGVEYPHMMLVRLEENYRSSCEILNNASELIQQDASRPPKSLMATLELGTRPTLRKLPNAKLEGEWISREIVRLQNVCQGLICAPDIAILVRSSYMTRPIELALTSAGIPYRVVGGRRFLEREEVRVLVDYLRVVNNHGDSSALKRVLNVPRRGIGDKTISNLSERATKSKCSLWQTLTSSPPPVKIGRKGEIEKFISLIRKIRQRGSEFSVEDAIDSILEGIAFRKYLDDGYQDGASERWQNVLELRSIAMDFSSNGSDLPDVGIATLSSSDPQTQLNNFIGNLALSAEVATENEKQASEHITISTIHAAKGLEWPVVFIPGAVEGSIPSSLAENIDEERRILYVAETRAQALLYVSYPLIDREHGAKKLCSFLHNSKAFDSLGPCLNPFAINMIATVLRRSALNIRESTWVDDDSWFQWPNTKEEDKEFDEYETHDREVGIPRKSADKRVDHPSIFSNKRIQEPEHLFVGFQSSRVLYEQSRTVLAPTSANSILKMASMGNEPKVASQPFQKKVKKTVSNGSLLNYFPRQ